MKISGHVTETKDCGDFMLVALQGEDAATPECMGSWRQELRVNANARNKRTFYIGRKVEITVRPR